MLLTQALQPLGCDDGPPAGKYPVFDLEFSPEVWRIVSVCMYMFNNSCKVDFVGLWEFITISVYTEFAADKKL